MQRAKPTLSALGVAAGVVAAGLLAGAAYQRYLVTLGPGAGARLRVSVAALRMDASALMATLVLCSLVGTLLARRYGLPGWLGDRERVRREAPALALAAAAASTGLYLGFGRTLATAVPGSYPASLAWALVRVAKGALVDEVVARWGLLTIFAGATRRLWLATILQALLATVIGVASLAALPAELGFGPLFWMTIVSSFVVSLGLGAVCVRHGLGPAMGVRALLDLRFVVHALVA